MDGPGTTSSFDLAHLDDVDFFSKDACGDPLYLNCNFVFLTRDDGSGSFPQNDPLTTTIISEMVSKMNDRWSSIRDHQNCSPNENYPFDSNIRVKVATHYIANTQAWDYQTHALNLPNYGSTNFCPQQIMNSATWPALRTVVNDFNTIHSDAINFFFVENGPHVKSLETWIEDDLEPASAWSDGVDVFSGCSRLPAAYHSDQDQFLVMVDFYTTWLARINFGTIYYPQHADEGNETIAEWHLNEMPITANHELGHSILNQFHTGDVII